MSVWVARVHTRVQYLGRRYCCIVAALNHADMGGIQTSGATASNNAAAPVLLIFHLVLMSTMQQCTCVLLSATKS